MGQIIAYRGPDDQGVYLENNIGLGQRRLSIIDLAGGHQPLSNEDQSVWITYNGEIYNYQEIRRSLLKQNHKWQTVSDTETLVHLYEEEGINGLQKINGMFAFGLWDKKQQKLILARDRLGIKPLYYYQDAEYIAFASELKALSELPFIKFEIDYSAMDIYLTYLYLPAPNTIFKNIKRLLPGEYLTATASEITLNKYWHLPTTYSPLAENENTLVTECYQRFKESIKLQLVSDVPVGVFLSGGLDSASIVAAMSELGVKEIKTFTIGFGKEKAYNETEFARAIANQFQTKHFELLAEPNVKDSLKKIVKHFDEPIADPAAIPLYQLAEFAAREVKVVLCGDGGDEIFGGYRRYLWDNWAAQYHQLPDIIRKFLSNGLKLLPANTKGIGNLIRLGQKFTQRAEATPEIRYLSWMMGLNREFKHKLYQKDFLNQISSSRAEEFFNNIYSEYQGDYCVNQLNYADLRSYLPYNLLEKVDRMTMAHSLEARVPFLDHNLVEWSLNLPPRLKTTSFQTKVIFRAALAGKLPPKIIQRKKMGFGVPLENWFKRDWFYYAKEELQATNSFVGNFISKEALNTMFDEHLKGKQNFAWQIYALLILELWYQNYTDYIPSMR